MSGCQMIMGGDRLQGFEHLVTSDQQAHGVADRW
jgi:hypothetical protein